MATFVSDGSVANIQALHNAGACVDGDTITIPSGSFTWTTGLTLTKNIILKGGSMFEGGSKTTINGSGAVTMITWETNSTAFTATLRDMRLIWGNTSTGPNMILIRGTATVRFIDGAWKGGCRITNVRFGVVNPSVGNYKHPFNIADWVTGVMDHCWADYPATTGVGAALVDVNHSSAPGHTTGPTPITVDGETFKPQMGQYSYSREYIWGAGPGVKTGSGDPSTSGNGDWDAFYFEDNIFCKPGLGVTSTDAGGVNLGGGRWVYRHNASKAQTGGHQFGGSGGDASGYVVEAYNNYYRDPINVSYRPHNLRGGAHIFFNERYEGYNDPGGVAGVQMDKLSWANYTGAMVGCSDGTNFFDDNHRGSLSANGFDFSPVVADSSDSRIGSVYGKSSGSAPFCVDLTGSTQWTLLRLDPLCAANKYVGFTVRNVTQSIPASDGCQSLAADGQTSCGYIATSTAGNAAGDVTITLSNQTGGVTAFIMLNNDEWELRYIDHALGVTGGTLIPTMNGGMNGNPSNRPIEFLDSQVVDGSPVKVYWCDQRPDGDWQWDNKAKAFGGPTWLTAAFDISGAADRLILGKKHNRIRTQANNVLDGSFAHVTYDYSEISSPTADHLRIGPDWDSDGSITGFGIAVNPETATRAWGYAYPHPLISAPTPPTGKIIVISGDMSFGNVIIGQTSVQSLFVSNTGDTSMHVNGITYPTGFSDAMGAFDVTGGATQEVPVTFTPVAETTYSGNLTVDSNADTGTETYACSGTGVPPAGGGGKGKGHKKGVLIARGR